mmetsp:Transcript_43177/g.104520  ORF Transcript_43177/g.104520 Transcript_43177/m.104520 type:complete len:810 (-) Transcript_43177:234-2663(-)
MKISFLAASPSAARGGSVLSKLLTAASTSLFVVLVILSSAPNRGTTTSTTNGGILLVEARYITSSTNELHHQQKERKAMPLQYEAEDGEFMASSVASNHDGFSGTGFVDFGGEGSFTSWSIDLPTSGVYDVTVRYASKNSRPLQLLLDDNVVTGGQFLIPATNSWTNWQTETVTVNLPAGNGQILKILAAQNPGPNVDFVILKLISGDDGGGISDDVRPPVATPQPTSAPDTGGGDGKLHVVLVTNQKMVRNSFTKSENGVYEVGLDGSGDLVVRNAASSAVLWSLAAEVQQPINGRAIFMQNDGNLVIRGEPTATRPNGSALWTSNTVGPRDSYHFTIDNSGGIAVVLLFQNSRVVWSGGLSTTGPTTSGPRVTPDTPFPTPPPVPSPPTPTNRPPTMPTDMPASVVLKSSQSLNRNVFTFSPNGVYSVGLEAGSGRFVLRKNGQEIWQLLNEEGDVVRNVDRAFMQSDGNLVFRSNSRPGSLWNSETSGNNGSELYVDDGGHVSVVYRGTALWLEGIPRGTYIRGRASSPDLTFPIRGQFYYPWYPETWSVNGKEVFYVPNLQGITRGKYKSGDPAAVSSHVKALDYSWTDLGIISWFGPRNRLDKARITQLMDETVSQGSSIKWTVYHEDERNRDASVDELVLDLQYLEEWFAWHPAFAHINGKPIILVYNEAGCEVADRWRKAADRAGWYVNLKLFPDFRNCPDQPDAWHQYGVDKQDGFLDYPECTVIAPGFWRSDINQPSLPRLGRNRFCQLVETMVQNDRDWQLVVSFNEWGEGTAVESATEWSSSSGYGQYLDCLRDPQLG